MTIMRLAAGVCLAGLLSFEPAQAANKIFNLVPAQTACETDATGRVTVSTKGGNQYMHVEISKLRPATTFELFILQVPHAPFGISWYQGDITTDANGLGVGDFVGIFSKETFNVAPGTAPAPTTFPTSANTNPAFNPVQMYHLGLWFDSPAAAQQAGCAGTVTPFNGPHNAGVQVLSSKNFGDLNGPLKTLP